MEEPQLEKVQPPVEVANISDLISRALVLFIPAPFLKHQVAYIKTFMNVRAQVALRPKLQPPTWALTFLTVFIMQPGV